MSTITPLNDRKAQALPLTEAQIAGLARLGDIGNQLGLLLDGPLAGPLAALATEGGEWYAKYDIPALVKSVVETADTLHRAGWFTFIRDHGEFVANSLEVLEPFLKQWVESSGKIPIDKYKADLEWLLEQLERGREISDFVKTQWSNEITEYMVAGTQYVQEQELIPAMRDLLGLLTQLHKAGLYEKLGSISEFVGRLDEGLNVELLVGQTLDKLPPDAASTVKQILSAASEALNNVEAHENEFGGMKGLLYLLRDKNVQKGLHVMTSLPALLADRNQNN